MDNPYATKYFRSDLGLHTDETFIVAVLGRLRWNRGRVEGDLYSQLFARLKSERAALFTKTEIVKLFDSKSDIRKIFKDGKDAVDSAKKFELSPMSIAKMTYGMLGGLWSMTQLEQDLAYDMNRYDIGTPDYYEFLLYGYLTRGRVQPRHQTNPA